jgi:hypothetical protein
MISIQDVLQRFIGGIRMLAVPRVEDLPYWTSPPIQFVYEQTADLALGLYTFVGAAAPLAINRPLLENCLYYFRNITISADVAEADYLGAISTTPSFQIYKASDNGVQLFREPVRICNYFQQFDYRMVWQTQQSNDVLTGSIAGVLTQTAGLVGKTSITMKVVIAAQEIVDQHYTRLFREQSYPQGVD